jgi:hypothetical protein
MKSRNDELTQRYLTLLRLDAKNVFSRIRDRKNEYLEIFALRRTREHFPMIFNNRYEKTTVSDLAHCSTDLIELLDQFYTLVDDIKWYLFKTEDMPNTVEDYIERRIIRLQKILTNLNLYIDAELGVATEQQSIVPVGASLESEFITGAAMDESDPFSTPHDDDTEASS